MIVRYFERLSNLKSNMYEIFQKYVGPKEKRRETGDAMLA